MNYKIIVFNWKLNGNKKLIKNIFDIINKKNILKNKIILSPPLIYINILNKIIEKIKKKNIFLCSQNIDFNHQGSYTGEISPLMLKEFNVKYSIIGHYERIKYHNESETNIIKKINSLIGLKIYPILCINDIKNNINESINYIKNKIYNILNNIKYKDKIFIAYEPTSLIGSDLKININEIKEILYNIYIYIKEYKNCFKNINLLYGGSVTSKNIKNILNLKEKNNYYINGVIVGRSSVNIKDFENIINIIS